MSLEFLKRAKNYIKNQIETLKNSKEIKKREIANLILHYYNSWEEDDTKRNILEFYSNLFTKEEYNILEEYIKIEEKLIYDWLENEHLDSNTLKTNMTTLVDNSRKEFEKLNESSRLSLTK